MSYKHYAAQVFYVLCFLCFLYFPGKQRDVMHYIFCQIIFLDIVILDVISTHSGALRPGSMFYAFPPIDWDYTFRPDPIEGLTKAPHALTVASDPSLKLKSISIADCKIRSSQPGKYITNIYVYLFRMDKCICILST